MKAIVLKPSTYYRVTSRLRQDGSLVNFSSLPSRVIFDMGFVYLYFRSFADLTCASDYLYAYNAVYRVADLSL